MGTISEKLTYLNTTKQKIKQGINSLGGKITDNTTFRNYAAELNSVYNKLPKVSDIGTYLSLSPTLEARLGLIPRGDTYQETYSGANLYNYKDTSDVTSGITVDDDGWITVTYDNTSGTSTKYFNYKTNNLNLLTDTDYNIVVEVKNVSGTGRIYGCSYYAPEGQFLQSRYKDFSDLTNNSVFVYSATTKSVFPSTGGTRSFVQFTAGQSGSITFRISVLEDTTITADTFEYEPYVGGQSSPNPDYPQNIDVVTGEQNVKISGKNLLDISQGFRNGYLNTSGVYYSERQSYLFNQYIEIVGGQTYIYSANQSLTNMSVFSFDENKTFIKREVIVYDKTFATITADSNAKYLVLGGNYDNSTTVTQEILNSLDFQLEQGSTVTEYEEYQEQNYPINLGKNLFDKNDIIEGAYISETGEIVSRSDAFYSKYISIKPNSYITVSGKTGFYVDAFYDKDKNFINRPTVSTLLVPNNAYYIRITGYIRDLNTIQLEKGSTATSYVSYKTPIELCKIGDYQDKICKTSGKNLFDKDNANILNAYTDQTLINHASSSTIYIPCNPNTTYTVSRQLIGKRFQVGECESLPTIGVPLTNLVPSNYINELSSITITTSSTAKYLCVFYSNIAGNNLANNNGYTEEQLRATLQIEEGSTATDYEPYGSDKWYLHKEIGKVILDGSENEVYDYQNNTRFYLSRSYFTEKTVPKNPIGASTTLNGLYCNRFKETGRSQTWAGTEEGISYDNPNTNPNVTLVGSSFDIACNSVATTVADFKTWLSNNPLEVVYILQNPQEIEITDTELIEQLEDLYNAKSYEGETNITVTTNDDLEMIMEASALKGGE